MKVLLLASSDLLVYKLKKELIERLINDGHEVIIAVPKGIENKKLETLGAVIVNFDIDRRGKNPLKDITLYKYYKQLIKREKPDKVITYTIKCNIYGGIVARKAKVDYYANITGLGTSFQGGFITRLVSILYKIALKKVKKVFFENEYNKKIFIDKKIIPNEKSVLTHGAGVNLKEYKEIPMPNTEMTRFIFIGRIMKEKGIDELLEAFLKLKEKEKNISLSLLGFQEDDYTEKIKKYTEKGLLDYHGFQDNILPYIEKSHCIVLPSYHEGMSNTLLEGAASGRPLIASDIPGCREVICEGRNGYRCVAKDAKSLYDCMSKFNQLSFTAKTNMGKSSRKMIENQFNREEVVNKTIEVMFYKAGEKENE